ncbi:MULTISPECIES: hypothetical protein [Streptomyces]|uniref:Uncharacterized protein n=3 Tax=Streptomyces rimosus TaxID=1927 RepID=L8EQ32_STRR1|nr:MULTISPECIES: hypothetical protein [Streptomyces]KOG77468.1 hypothetical protein ADK78_08680 [Kitasatospora aureofaciens]MYT44689.1 hypothetical protein [Streptomyces sp. SID5471]KOT43057.1 hypothetical protein ADK84_09005 [Streptomyces sp. NRRL WC-3701]KOT62353.1 hypothetical protein ADK44_12410 [Streptomyces rimosus subsp. rimosus]KOT62615.1 hypothetical protein ADK45_16740 [Streptomyces rimosus subsp. rimosus]
MGWVDPQYAHLLREDGRYGRMINMTLQLLRERERERERQEDDVPRCGSCHNGQITVEAPDGSRTTITCERCDGSGTVPEPPDDPRNGATGGYEPDLD